MASNTASTQVYNYLVGRDLDPEIQKVPNPDDPANQQTLLTFDFIAPSGKNYGTAVILMADSMQMYFGDNLGRTMEGDDKQSWYDFLLALRNIAKRNMMTYDWKDLSKLKHNLRGQAKLREAVFESLSGNRTRSWSAPTENTRLVIYHNKAINEGDARFRYIDKIFVETAEGERYKLPFKNLRGAKAMLEHVKQGGRPYDLRGQHIIEMVSDLNVLSRFRRANHGKIFEGETQQIVEQSDVYYHTTKKNLDRLASQKGYQTYFENWNPVEDNADNIMVEDLRSMFVELKLDQRIESALPILAKVKHTTLMKEAGEFEQWSKNLVEGTWALPDTPVEKEKLKELLSKPIPVGVDAINATELLYDIFGDDELFDKLSELAKEDPDADARDVIIDRMMQLDDAFNIEDYMPDDLAPEPEAPEAPETQVPEPQPNPTPQPAAPVAQPAPVDPAPMPPGTMPAQPVREGRVRQLSMDMSELNDAEFFDKYKKTKNQVRDKIGPHFTSRDARHKEEMAKLKSLLSRLNA